MSIELKWKHQTKTYELMQEELESRKRAAYIYPTGAGKSFPALKYIEDNEDKTAIILVPSRAIKKQYEKYIRTYMEDGEERLKSPSRKKNENTESKEKGRIVIITYQKLTLMQKEVKNIHPDIILEDEIHRTGAETWEPALDWLEKSNEEAEVIGMTATPQRTDKRDMITERFGENVVYEMSLTEALSGDKEGEVVLQPVQYIRVLSEFKEQLREYKKAIESIEDQSRRERLIKRYERLETIVSRSPDIQDIMETGMKKKNGKYLVFCKDQEDLKEKMEQAQSIFGKVNPKINVQYVFNKVEGFGKTAIQNDRTIQEFEQREKGEELNLLFCVDKLNEGIHIEGIDGEVLFDLTASPVLYKQRIGRVMTTEEREERAVIIDASNNWLNQIDTYKEIEGAIQRGEGRKPEEEIDLSLLKLLPEEEELINILREIGEEIRVHTDVYNEIIEWLESHDGEMPRSSISINGKKLNAQEMTEEQRKERNLYRRWRDSKEWKVLDEYAGRPIEEVPEEYREKIEILRKYGLGLKKKTTFEELVEWLEQHDGEMPRSSISINGKKLNVQEMTEEQKEEPKLYARWNISKERKVLNEYAGRPIEEVPKEWREKMAILRSYGLEKKSTFEEMVEWLEEHDGEMPRSNISIDGKKINVQEMTEEQREEKNLYGRWKNSNEKKVLEEYAGKPLEEVPEEWREKIAILRSYGLEKKSTFEEMVEWLEEHDGEMPKTRFKDAVGKSVPLEKWTEGQREERNLYQRWNTSKEKEILEEYYGRPIEEVPEEWREKIVILRNYGLGLEKETVLDEIIEWLEEHDGEIPRSSISIDGKQLKVSELTEEQKNEVNLRERWRKSKYKEILDEYAGKPLEEVPEKWREKIAKLRKYGLGLKKKRDKTTLEEIVEWLEEHDGEMPRGGFCIDGKQLNVSELTEVQREEQNLYGRWNKSKEKKVLEEYAGIPIEEIPEEWREKIAILRSYGFGLEKKTTFEELVEWLEEHEGEMPKNRFKDVDGKVVVLRKEMTEEQIKERNLYARWNKSKEKKVLDEYEGIPIEKIPKEWREKIAILRNYGFGLEKKTTFEELVEWLEHDGKMPSSSFYTDGKQLKVLELTEEQREEKNLYARWNKSKEKKVLDEYAGRPLEEVPEEYREKIKILRSYGIKGSPKKKTTFEELVEWLEEHNEEMPRQYFTDNGKILYIQELTEEQRQEKNLRKRWSYSKEKKMLDKYVGRMLEEVPEEYREKIEILRKHGLGLKKKITFEELVEWLEEHDGEMPRSTISFDGKQLNVSEMTEEQREERNLYQRWNTSKEKEILEECYGRPLEEVPEEYREKIKILRSYGIKGSPKKKRTGKEIVKATISAVKDENADAEYSRLQQLVDKTKDEKIRKNN